MTRHRSDSNSKILDAAFKNLGFSVANTGQVGDDFPDRVIANCGHTFLAEYKTKNGELSDGQSEFRQNWKGTVFVVRNINDVKRIYNLIKMDFETWWNFYKEKVPQLHWHGYSEAKDAWDAAIKSVQPAPENSETQVKKCKNCDGLGGTANLTCSICGGTGTEK